MKDCRYFFMKAVLYVQILTPLQQARMQVAAYPWPPDSLAICGIVAEQTGQIGRGR